MFGGWEIWRVKLISTQVVIEVEVGVELGKRIHFMATFLFNHIDLGATHFLITVLFVYTPFSLILYSETSDTQQSSRRNPSNAILVPTRHIPDTFQTPSRLQ